MIQHCVKRVQLVYNIFDGCISSFLNKKEKKKVDNGLIFLEELSLQLEFSFILSMPQSGK